MDPSPLIAPHAARILRTLAQAGHAAYAVGGCVRDLLLGRPPHDWDVATDARDGEIRRLFDRTVPTGVKYGTVTVLTEGGGVEVTTFRRDGAYLDGRRPESVSFTGSLREDLSRRDFTVNAMAMDLEGRVTDLHGGLEDLRRGVIRCVGVPGERFAEDALRMLRAVRFAAQLGFQVEPETLAAIRELAPLAGRLSAERVRGELEKLLASPRPERVRELVDLGLLDRFLDRGDLPSGRLEPAPEDLRLPVFALLCVRGGLCRSAGEPLRALRCPAREVRDAAEAEALDLAPEPRAIRMALCLGRERPVLIAAAAAGAYALAGREIRERAFVRPAELAVSGRDLRALGLTGPAIGEALRDLAGRVTAGELENRRESLLAALQAGKRA